MSSFFKILAIWGLSLSLPLTGGAKVKRVKAGKFYKEHDAVHIVVNKVG